jgi:hypothetical protein
MTYRAKYPSMLMMASVVVAAIISAPTANAVPTCQEAGSVTRCQTNGSVSIKAVPGTRAPNVAESIPRGNNRSGIILSW